MKTILVTGAAGFIGAKTSELLLEAGRTVKSGCVVSIESGLSREGETDLNLSH